MPQAVIENPVINSPLCRAAASLPFFGRGDHQRDRRGTPVELLLHADPGPQEERQAARSGWRVDAGPSRGEQVHQRRSDQGRPLEAGKGATIADPLSTPTVGRASYLVVGSNVGVETRIGRQRIGGQVQARGSSVRRALLSAVEWPRPQRRVRLGVPISGPRSSAWIMPSCSARLRRERSASMEFESQGWEAPRWPEAARCPLGAGARGRRSGLSGWCARRHRRGS